MRMVKKAAYLAWLLLAGAVFGLFIAGCQTDSPDSDNDNKTENPSDNPADNPSGGNEIGSVFGVYTNPKTGLKYAFNEDGTYSISKNDTSIESGTFKNQNDVSSNIRGIVARAMREQSAKSVKYGYLLTPKNMGGAKASEKNPRNSKITVIKTKNPGAIFGNTPMFTEKDLKEIAEKPAVTVWIQAENLPKVSYNVDSDTTVEKVTDAISAKNESGRWFKYYFENCSEISLNVNYGSDTKSFDVANSTVYISKDKNILTEKPEDFTFDENYKSSSDKLYLMGTFAYQDEADNAEQIQWKAIDGFNDFKEIDKNIYKLSMYLPQNIYGFKISIPGFKYDYSIPFDVKGSVPKNEWFNVIKSDYSVWSGKNGALATGGGYYNFFLDLSDMANPIMLVATDEQSDKVVEDANLYVVGDFTGWKFDEKYQLAETEKGSGIYSLTESVEIPASKDGKKQGFKISDKTWGAMTGEYAQNNGKTIELKENQYIAVDETYATRTQNSNLEYSFDGTYNFYLNVNTSQLKIENPNASTPEQKPEEKPEPKIATIYFYDSNGDLTNKTHNAKVGTQITEEILNKYSSESDIFGWYIKDTNKKLDLPFTITSDLDIYPRVAETLEGNWVKNYLGKITVKPGNFYMCEIKGHTVTELNGRTDFATDNADSYGSNEFRIAADSEFTITSVCYAYNSGYANMSLKMANDAKVLIDSVRFDKVTLADDSEYGLSYGEKKLVVSKETGNLEYTLILAAGESITGKFYNYTHYINLLYNSIDYVSNGLELTCEDDNSFTVTNTTDKTLNVTFSMNPTTLKVSLLLKDSMQQIELDGNNVEKVIGTYDVEAGNFYKCTLTGSSAIAGKNVIRSLFRTEAKDSISHGYNAGSSIYFEQYLYAYETGKASLVLKSENAGKILIESVEFEKLGTSLESDRFLLTYNNDSASLSFDETENSNIKECTYFLGANSTFDGIIVHQDYHFILLSNSIEPCPSELTLSEKGDNLVIKNNTDTDLNLTFSLNTGTRKVTLTTEEISAPEFNGNWYSYEIDTTNFSAETISLIFNFSAGPQSYNIENVQKSGVVYYEWDYSSRNYYISKKENKPSAEIENGKLKVFVYTNAESCNLYYWGNTSDSDYTKKWPGVTMTPVSTSAGE